MSAEIPDESYESDFAAPVHSVVHVGYKGSNRITSVIIDGVVEEFEVSEALWRQGQNLAHKQEGQNE